MRLSSVHQDDTVIPTTRPTGLEFRGSGSLGEVRDSLPIPPDHAYSVITFPLTPFMEDLLLDLLTGTVLPPARHEERFRVIRSRFSGSVMSGDITGRPVRETRLAPSIQPVFLRFGFKRRSVVTAGSHSGTTALAAGGEGNGRTGGADVRSSPSPLYPTTDMGVEWLFSRQWVGAMVEERLIVMAVMITLMEGGQVSRTTTPPDVEARQWHRAIDGNVSDIRAAISFLEDDGAMREIVMVHSPWNRLDIKY